MTASEKKKKLRNWRLPVISKTTLDAMQQVYAGKKWGQHLTEVQQRLIQENPYLITFIENQVGKYPRALHNPLFEVFVATITMLEHQALVDEKEIERQDGSGNR
jgi:hypothetical protein